MKKIKFSNNFLLGSATSGPQSEGTFNKVNQNIYDYWSQIEPEAFYDKVGTEVTSNFYNDFKKDIKMYEEIGYNSIRISIQWSRLIKNFETLEVDEDGVNFYNQVINEFLSKNIEVIINLNHFDIPYELFEKYKGWESKHVSELFSKYSKLAFELFGDRIKKWVTFNEPIVILETHYLYKYHFPYIADGKRAVQVMFNLALASAKAILEFRKTKCFKEGGEIGIILNLTPSYPRSDSKEDVEAANFCDAFFNKSFLDTSIKGEFPKLLVDTLKKDDVLWDASEEELDIIKNNKIDFLGVNYYQPKRIKKREKEFKNDKWFPDQYFEIYDMPNKRMNVHRGWEIYPEAIYDIAMDIKNNYSNIPWYLSENGMGVSDEERFRNSSGVIEDDYRIEFYEEHLSYLMKAIEDGSNCFGFHAWTGIDCWSWANAYKNRYGFIEYDLKTREKRFKKSAEWFKNLISESRFKK